MATKSTPRVPFWNLDKIMHLIIGIVLSVGLVFLVRYLSNVLLPFVAACFIAYIMQPLVAFNQRWTHLKGRVVPSLLTLLEVAVVLGLLAFAFTPTVVKDIDMLSDIIHDVSDGRREIPAYCVPVIEFVEKYINSTELHDILTGAHLDTLLSKGSSLVEESLDIIMQTLEWLLTLIYIIFILIDYPKMSAGFKLIFPGKYRTKAMNVVHEVQDNMNRYFRGQGKVALCAAFFYCIGFSIVGLPLAIPMGIIVGILYMIPYFQYVTLVPVAVIAFIYSLGGTTEFWPLLGKCGLVYVISQSICDYLITPHIMGREMGMNPAIILLSLSVWGSLMGIIGMIIALPLTSLLMTYYERYVSK